MPVILFYPRFHDLVATGAKRQTIREARKRPIKVGDRLSLRAWEGTPYRSKQRLLREARCSGVAHVLISAGAGHLRRCPLAVERDGVVLPPPAVRRFAQADGFRSVIDMAAFWAEHRHLPFEGVVIYWE